MGGAVKRPRGDYKVAARDRVWGLPVMRLWRCGEQQAIAAAPRRAPQVNLTVIHVEAGAYLNVGGVFIDPRLAVPQQQAAVTEGTPSEKEKKPGA
jgi:hypothetical protein